ncbi:MAG: hypothetical protein GY710_26255 [Desulfobacteraceae bacterium]|nr:hypothetical protein [Desulfobacteraceae bacterium]
MADKTAYHPDGVRSITFLDEPHTYTDNLGVRYQSGTSFSKPYFPQFAAKKQSIKSSRGKNPKYAGRDPQEIEKEWLAEGHRGSSEGDNAHLYAEGIMEMWEPLLLPQPISDRCEKLFSQVNKAADYLLTRYDFIEAEKVIFSPKLGLAGMIDLLMRNPDTGEILILDWKQNKKISTENRFQSGFPPISHLQDTAINKYSIQLSTYQYILIKDNYFPDATGFKRGLIHLTPTDFKLIPVQYYDYEIKEILKYERRI